VAAISDRGRIRRINEDSYLAHPPVFVVADGMGGHRYGDRASSATAQTFASTIPIDQPTTVAAIVAAVGEAHRRVVELAEGEQAGTTLSGLALVQEPGDERTRWMAFNIGDSRVYSWSRGQGLEQISVDHSAVQELIDEGEITRAQAEAHPERNVITRAVGSGDLPDADVWLFPASGDQHFIICSDGLTKELSDDVIARVCADADGEPEVVALNLVGAALEAGAADNVTVVIVASSMLIATESRPGDLPLDSHLETTLPREDKR